MGKEDKRYTIVGAGLVALMLISWGIALWVAPTDKFMGEVYRIIYVHVPSAFIAFLHAFILFGCSLFALVRRSERMALWAKASAEVGLIFTICTLITGSIWGRPTWGVWWEWDARLTTTLLHAILLSGYLVLYSTLPRGSKRNSACAGLGVIIFASVFVIYKSVTWWRTLHQPPSLMREGGSTMDSEMIFVLLLCFGSMFIVSLWLLHQRTVNLKIEDQLESAQQLA